MTEAQMTSALLKRIRKAQPWLFAHKVNERIQGGIPDAYFIVDGNHIHVEFKGPKTSITPLQRQTIDKMRRAGAVVLLVRFDGVGTAHKIEEPGGYEDQTLDAYLTRWKKIYATGAIR